MVGELSTPLEVSYGTHGSLTDVLSAWLDYVLPDLLFLA